MTFKIEIAQFYGYKETQTMEIKQNQTFFHRTYSNLTSFFIARKILKYFNDFYNFVTLQFHCKIEKKTSKMK